jgi:predicted Zn-dependent protease
MPSESAPWETMGEIAELSGDPATAERRYLAAIEAQSGSTLARARLAALYLDSGRYSEAEVIMAGLSEPLELPPKHLARLARAEHRAGFYDRALERLRQGLDSHPEAPELRRALQELSRPAIPEA